jgi:putative pectin methyltransferase
VNKFFLLLLGLLPDELGEDSDSWKAAVQNYWSLLSPVIFSDHPKRPGDEDPSPPYNMFRNVLDMNANFGGFNSALLQARKSVWVMNVVPRTGPNYLPLIQDRGFVGVLHDWYFNLLPFVLIWIPWHVLNLLSFHNLLNIGPYFIQSHGFLYSLVF